MLLAGNQSTAKTRDDDLDYDYSRVVEEVRDVIRSPIFDSHSVILLNAGLHYLESTNFTNYQKTIDGIVDLFKEIQTDAKEIKRAFPGKLIWKSSTSLNKQKLDGKHLQSRRFLTSHVSAKQKSVYIANSRTGQVSLVKIRTTPNSRKKT